MKRIAAPAAVGYFVAAAAFAAPLPAGALPPAPRPVPAIWRDASFADFSAGTMDGAGANLYVSKQGVLQTVRRYDIDQNGAPDIVFDSSHDFAYCLPATVWAGGKAGLSAKPAVSLPTNGGQSAVVGEDGAGRPLVLLLGGFNGTWNGTGLRIFRQGRNGLDPKPAAILFNGMHVAAATLGKDKNGRGVLAVAVAGTTTLPGTRFGESFIRVYAGVPSAPGAKPALILPVPSADTTSLAIANGYLYAATRGTVRRFPLDLSDKAAPRGEPLPGTSVQKLAPAKLPGANAAGLLYLRGPGKSLQWLKDADPAGVPTDLPVIGAAAAEAGDFDGDGHTDLAVASGNTVTVLTSRADRTLHKTAELPAPWGSAVAVGDFNGDGRPDIAAACSRGALRFQTHSYVYWNAGGAKGFSAAHRNALPTAGATDVAAGDLTGRGGTDLLFVNSASGQLEGRVPSMIYYSTKGRRTFRRQDLPTVGAYEAKAADFNDDGYPDVVVACDEDASVRAGTGTTIFWGGPHGLGTRHPSQLPTGPSIGVSCADLNKDGYVDLAVSETDTKGLRICWGSSSGFRAANSQVLHTPDHDDPRFPLIADLNRDGWLDIVVPDIYKGTSVLYWGGPQGFDSGRCQILPVPGGCAAQSADLNGDGWPDLVLTSWWDPSKKTHYSPSCVYWGGPDGFSPSRRADLTMNGAEDCAVADLNGDGRLDLVFTTYEADTYRSLNSFIYWGGKDGTFRQDRRTGLFNDSGSGCFVADFDGDGWPDIAIANHTKDGSHIADSRVWWGGPQGYSTKNVTLLPTIGPHLMYGADMGNVLTRKPEEAFVSRVYQRPAGLRPGRVSWAAATPPGTTVTLQLRSAATPEALRTAAWTGPKGAGSSFARPAAVPLLPALLAGRYLQYRLILHTGTGGGSPRVRQVEVTFAR